MDSLGGQADSKLKPFAAEREARGTDLVFDLQNYVLGWFWEVVEGV